MNKDVKILFFSPIVFLPVILTSMPFFFFKFSFWWAPQVFFTISCIISITIITFVIKIFSFNFSDFGWNRNFKWFDFILATCFCLAGIMLWGIMIFILDQIDIVPWTINYHYSNKIVEIPVILSFILIGVITEETLFRGFLITSIARKSNIWIASTISIIIFSFYHYIVFGIGAFLLIFVWSILPTILFVWRKNIYVSILMHLLNNFFAYIIYPIFINSY